MNTNIKPKTTHLDRLTDNFGVWQFFENGAILRSEGYALDDAARALIVYILYENETKAEICMNYIERSLRDGLFVGFWDEHNKEVVYPSSHDAHGLALWALAFAIKYNFKKNKAEKLLAKINTEILLETPHLRARSYALVAFSLQKDYEKANKCVSFLQEKFNSQAIWFEEKLTYANAVIPYSLITYLTEYKNEIKTNEREKIEEIIKTAIKTLETYMRIDAVPSPVGSDQWQKIGDNNRCLYGQQPIDAAFMVIMLCKMYEYAKQKTYKTKAEEWMGWFYGNNIVKQNLITQEFACADWIRQEGVSKNYGSESTIMYLWAQKTYNLIINKTEQE